MVQYLLQLMMTHGIGDKAVKKILRFAHDSGMSLKEVCEQPEVIASVLGKHSNINKIFSDIRSNSAAAEKLALLLEKENIKTITENDTIYPLYLKDSLCEDCPPILFTKGNAKLLAQISVGFCGSRKVSSKGEEITEKCAGQLAEHNVAVVSGYASGTDLAAHAAVLRNHGTTVFILAEGILNYRIKQQVKSYLDEKNHVFVSQFLPTAQWSVGNAMKRNSLIIGLSRAMILVESGKTGGTFAAGEETLQRKKPLFVIDFEKPEVSAEANPYFIKRGGNPIRGINGVPSLGKVYLSIEDKTEYRAPEQLKMESFVYI